MRAGQRRGPGLLAPFVSATWDEAKNLIKEYRGKPVWAVAARCRRLVGLGRVDRRFCDQQVLAVLAAKTGYEPDMIEMDMALETELGVDSIKRVEILITDTKGVRSREPFVDTRRANANATRRGVVRIGPSAPRLPARSFASAPPPVAARPPCARSPRRTTSAARGPSARHPACPRRRSRARPRRTPRRRAGSPTRRRRAGDRLYVRCSYPKPRVRLGSPRTNARTRARAVVGAMIKRR